MYQNDPSNTLEVEMSHTQATDLAVEPLRLDEQLPADQQPAAVYLSGLAACSKPAMSQALNSTAQLVLKDDKATAYDIPWHTMRFQHVQKIRQDLEADENLSYSTVNKYLAAIRGTLKAAWKLGQMSSEDYYRAVSVENVKGERLPTGRHINAGEISAMLATCEQDAMGIRDAAILSIWVTAGLRRAELAALDLADYTPNEEYGELVVQGKRNKERTAYIQNGTFYALRDWLTIRGADDGPLFISLGNRSKGGRMSSQALYYVLQKRAKLAGVPDITPHDMRRTFISNLLDAGADLSIAQKLAGHASPTTTARYDRRPERAKQQAVAKLSVPYTPRTLPQVDEEE
jgi:integrase